MNKIEHPFLFDRLLHRFPVEIEVILEEGANSISVLR
jgi:hypothetical protein